MESLEIQILELGTKRDIQSLEKLLAVTDKQDLSDLIKVKFNSPSFGTLWGYILQGFSDKDVCHKRRLEIIMLVLNELGKREVFSSQNCLTLVQQICLSLVKLKTEHLIELCNYCLNILQSNKASLSASCIWSNLLPDCLRVLSEKDIVLYNELEYTGEEFRSDFISNICMGNWSPEIITPLTVMFTEMSVSKEEHKKIVNKLSCYIEKLTPQEIPPLVYQLLKLCRHQNSHLIFLKLQDYFNHRIYKNTNLINSNSESPDLDCIESAEDHDALEAESTVLFHIQSAASIGHNCIKDYLNFLKNLVKAPKYILQPFQLLALFRISTVQQYQEIVFDIIRSCIVKSYNEQQRSNLSFWYRDLCQTKSDPETLFMQIINMGDREYLLESLVSFSFVLLNVGSGLGRDIIAEKQWSLGNKILIKIIQKKRYILMAILKTICIHVVTKQSAIQYVDCLYILCKEMPLLMLENQNSITELMESLVQIPEATANQLLYALTLLTRASPTIRDQLILILRKGLYSRSMETRQVAVNGFVKLIATLKLSTIHLQSESSASLSSGYSLYTQISLGRASQTLKSSNFSNEAICWEILGILKRCFVQQIEVKSILYESLSNAVDINEDLGIPVLETLWFHFMEYYIIDEETIPPLNFIKSTSLKETNSILVEPLGKLIYSIAHITAKLNESEDKKDNSTVIKYGQILDSICNRMINCEFVHLELDDGSDLTDILPESQQKMLVLKEVLTVYEALIGYKILTWTRECENQASTISSLFQAYNRFLHFGKNLSKPKKGKKKDKTTQKDSQISQKQTQKNESHTSNTRINDDIQKIQGKPFKVPDCILTFDVVEKSFKILLESSVSWGTVNQVNMIKTKTNIHRHFIQAAIFLINKLKSQKLNNRNKQLIFRYVSSLCKTIYDRIILRFNDYVDFDCTSAIWAIECFHSIILLISNQYKERVVDFFSEVGGKEKEVELIEHLKPFFEVLKKLFDTDEDELSNEIEIKKLSLILFNCISVFCGFLPNHSNVLSIETYDWLKGHIYEATISHKVCGAFLNLLFELHLRYRPGLDILEKVATFCGESQSDSMNETDEQIVVSIEKEKFNPTVLSLCTNIKVVLDDVDNIVGHMKAEFYILNVLSNNNVERREENLRVKEKGISCQLCFVTKILTSIVNALIILKVYNPEPVTKYLIQFYSSVSALTKYFLGKSSKNHAAFQGVWFEKLIKLVGKELNPNVYDFIGKIGESTEIGNNEKQSSSKTKESIAAKNKFLKQSKLIPKIVYEIEQLSRYLIQLTKKTKVDLSKYIGQGVARDFRVKPSKQSQDESGSTQQSEDSPSEEEEPNEDDNIAENSNDEDPTPSKKRRYKI